MYFSLVKESKGFWPTAPSPTRNPFYHIQAVGFSRPGRGGGCFVGTGLTGRQFFRSIRLLQEVYRGMLKGEGISQRQGLSATSTCL